MSRVVSQFGHYWDSPISHTYRLKGGDSLRRLQTRTTGAFIEMVNVIENESYSQAKKVRVWLDWLAFSLAYRGGRPLAISMLNEKDCKKAIALCDMTANAWKKKRKNDEG